MAYLGKGPSDTFSGVTSKDSFTGDGSTVNFDISTDIPQGGDTDIFVYVDNVRQEPGVSKAYTTGQDGSGNYRRITFTTAPDSGAEIYVLNPGRIEALQVTGDNSVSAAKIQSSAVTTAKINDAAVTTAKLGSAAVTNTNLDTSIITGFTELAEVADNGDFLIIYDSSTGTLKKIQRSNITLQVPTVSSISPTNVDSKDSATTTTFTVTGTGFDSSVTAKLISNGGTEISFNTVTRDSITQLTCVLNNGLVTAVTDEPYDIKVTNSSGLSNTLADQINVDQRPVFLTAAGSLGSVADSTRISTTFTIEATDPESAGAVRYDVISGSLPAGASLNSSTGVISTFNAVGADTTSTFTIQASDVDSNVSFRDFSITILAPVYQSFTSSGTFSVPSGVTAVDVLVVAGGGGGGFDQGGGGGAGGLIFRPGFTVTPGGTVSVTVGDGGAGTQGPAQRGTTGQDSVFGTLTAKGGGGAGSGDGAGPHNNGSQGGSGGATGWRGPTTPAPVGSGVVGQGIQPTQPGDSGTYGFGNPAGAANGYTVGDAGRSSGGGGGAGAAGSAAAPHPGPGGAGGIGRAYTIADGTTSVYYAGGGGGSGGQYPGHTVAPGGQGGGGAGGEYGAGTAAVSAQANKGGGGGGGVPSAGPTIGGSGGKGIVIVSY
jgi:hypothetical protein